MSYEDQDPFEHWRRTGTYLYKGVAYSHAPHHMTVDAKDGTIRMRSVYDSDHNLIIYRVPDHILFTYEVYKGKMVIDLDNTPYRGSVPKSEGTLNWVLEHDPVFYAFDVPLSDVLWSKTNVFGVVSATGDYILIVQNVPNNIIEGVFTGVFTTITLGRTGRYWAGC